MWYFIVRHNILTNKVTNKSTIWIKNNYYEPYKARLNYGDTSYGTLVMSELEHRVRRGVQTIHIMPSVTGHIVPELVEVECRGGRSV